MKKIACMLLAASPLAVHAIAEGKSEIRIDEQQLESAVALTTLLDEDVRLSDGGNIGELGDVLLEQAAIKEFLVDFDAGSEYQRGAASLPEDVADYGESPLLQGESRDEELNLEYVAVPAVNLGYDAEENVVVINLGAESFSALPQRDRGVSLPTSGVYGRDVIGMAVHLADENDFGSVEDVMLQTSSGSVVAFVVESRDGLARQLHALPADAARFQTADSENVHHDDYVVDSVHFPFTSEELEALEEFDLDAYRDNGWDIF